MTKVDLPNGVETLPKFLIAWVGCTNVRDRQADRQTGGFTTTYSEREPEFTFTKKPILVFPRNSRPNFRNSAFWEFPVALNRDIESHRDSCLMFRKWYAVATHCRSKQYNQIKVDTGVEWLNVLRHKVSYLLAKYRYRYRYCDTVFTMIGLSSIEIKKWYRSLTSTHVCLVTWSISGSVGISLKRDVKIVGFRQSFVHVYFVWSD